MLVPRSVVQLSGARFTAVSVHVEELGRVDAMLIDGTWLGVDPGSLQRHLPMHRSSGNNVVIYNWTYASHQFMAQASDVKAVRLISMA